MLRLLPVAQWAVSHSSWHGVEESFRHTGLAKDVEKMVCTIGVLVDGQGNKRVQRHVRLDLTQSRQFPSRILELTRLRCGTHMIADIGLTLDQASDELDRPLWHPRPALF